MRSSQQQIRQQQSDQWPESQGRQRRSKQRESSVNFRRIKDHIWEIFTLSSKVKAKTRCSFRECWSNLESEPHQLMLGLIWSYLRGRPHWSSTCTCSKAIEFTKHQLERAGISSKVQQCNYLNFNRSLCLLSRACGHIIHHSSQQQIRQQQSDQVNQ